jgi:integrase
MPRYPDNHVPKLTRRSDGRAVVRLDGEYRYCGRYGTAQATAEYNRLVGEWLANGRRLPPAEVPGEAPPTVADVIVAFMAHAREHYVKAGRQTQEVANYKIALRHLRGMYAHTPAKDFGPLALEAVRNGMVAAGWARTNINRMVGRLRSVFRWAVSREMVPPQVITALEALPPLLAGRTKAAESEPVEPVAPADLAAALPHLPPGVRALVDFQLLTGCRPGEAVALRVGDIDMTAGAALGRPDVWVYRVRPETNKTAHKGRDRVVMIGPRAREMIAPLLTGRPGDPVFRKARRPHGPYTVGGYRQAVEAACEAAAMAHIKAAVPAAGERLEVLRKAWRDAESAYGTSAFRKRKPTADERRELRDAATLAGRRFRAALEPVAAALKAPRPWFPHQLRHSAATMLEGTHGIEAAQAVLGHARPDTTRIYSLGHLRLAAEAAAKSG